jgi:hypothetical protein
MAETGFENASAVRLHKNRMEKSFDCLKGDYHLDTEPMRLPYPPAARDRPAGRGNSDAQGARMLCQSPYSRRVRTRRAIAARV